MHVLSAVASIGALGRENDQLIKATAKQAATIRTLTERNSSLEAEVNIEKYNVEFLKQQGRKTRSINREKLRRLGTKFAELARSYGMSQEKLRKVEAANHILRQQMSSLIEQHTQLQRKHEELMSHRARFIYEGPQPYEVGMKVEYNHMFDDHILSFDHCAFRARFTDLDIGSMKPEALRVLADVTAQKIVKGIRERVVTTMLNHFGVEPETTGQKAERLMRQQRQHLSDF